MGIYHPKPNRLSYMKIYGMGTYLEIDDEKFTEMKIDQLKLNKQIGRHI